ncbi:MFS transporter [Pseudonocardia lacus]|uniref:MFS transporter n=1 Tax=Pseudonocardia lacus TaxID=2835865 RepID=UPI001BDD6CFC|nr:MFS transporter [Pseudonocardia lacus]
MPFPLDPARLLRAARATGPPAHRLRVAVTVLFALDGAVFGSWAARIPDVAARTGADATALGLALLCVSLGALASMQLTGALCARLGAGLVGAASAVLLGLTAALPGLSTTVPELAVALVVFGAATGCVNVAANSLGVEVERRAARPVLAPMHAAFSLGGLAGAAVGGLVAGTAPAPHLIAVGAVGLLVAAAIAPTLLAGDAPRRPASQRSAPARGPRPLLVALGLIAGCTAFGEGAFTDWGALHLRDTLGASPAAAAAGYATFSAAMAVGRLTGGRLARALGDTQLLAGGSLVAALGVVAAVATPSVPVALAGFALVGLGLANVFPLAVARAGALGGSGGVALASTVGYTGLLGGPPVIGLLAGGAGIATALSTVAVLSLVGAGIALAIGTGRAADLTRTAAARVGTAARPVAAPPTPLHGRLPDSPYSRSYRDVLGVLNGARTATVPA